MSILYSKIQRINPQHPEDESQWYISPHRVGRKSEKEIAEALTKNTTLSKGEAMLVLYELQSVVIDSLLDGYTVQIGDWGSFQLTVSCKGSPSKTECTTDKIKSVNIRFRPGKEMKKALTKASFRSL